MARKKRFIDDEGDTAVLEDELKNVGKGPAAEVNNAAVNNLMGQSARPKYESTMVKVLKIDPNRCRPHRITDRFDTAYSPDQCLDLVELFIAQGQDQPAKAIRIQDDPDVDFEIVYGRRRWVAAKHIRNTQSFQKPDFNLQIIEIVQHPNEKDDAFRKRIVGLIISENDSHLPTTKFEKCLTYRKLLGKVREFDAVYESNIDLWESLKLAAMHMGSETISVSALSKMIRAGIIAEQPDIMGLFDDPRLIPYSKAYDLSVHWEDKKDNGARERILDKALAIAKTDVNADPADIFDALIAVADPVIPPTPPVKTTSTEKISFAVGGASKKDLHGKFSLSQGISLKIKPEKYIKATKEDILKAVEDALDSYDEFLSKARAGS